MGEHYGSYGLIDSDGKRYAFTAGHVYRDGSRIEVGVSVRFDELGHSLATNISSVEGRGRMTPAKVRPLKQPMRQMSWAEVRQALDEHQQALTQLFGNCDALKDAMHGEIVDGKLVSPVTQSFFALREMSFWGRLRWLLTGTLG